MKKWMILFLMVAVFSSLCACSGNINAETPADPSAGYDQTGNTSENAPTERESRYGELQELIDSYGFPFKVRLTEGMELIYIEIFEDHAERYRTHSLEDHPTLYENLAWSIEDDHLIISGEWEQEFIIHIEEGTATSLSDGKEYRLCIYDENGDGHFYVE